MDHNQCIASTVQEVAYSNTLTDTSFDVHLPGRCVYSSQCYGFGGTQPGDEGSDVMSLIPAIFFRFFLGEAEVFFFESVTPGKNQSKGGARLYFLL